MDFKEDYLKEKRSSFPMKIRDQMRLAYCGIRVTDLERSLKFYAEVLGLKKVGRGKMNHGCRYALLEDKETGQRIELNWYPKGSRFYSEYILGEGMDHLGFEVEDVNKTYERLLSEGATSGEKPWKEVPNDEKSWIGFVKDPDGIWIELVNKIPSEEEK